ncbi:hypothetical protein [Flavobacterium sp. DSR2-3-3]|uniref:hypothetical protein n=1 Tax=Flavobacterium sp. DSR2-3-3 TaxID=2804632 RepID=UPI003CF2A6D2
MKKLIFTFIVTLFFASLASAQDTTNVATGKIYFLRSTDFQGSAVAFKTFVDGAFVCKLNNKNYSVHEVAVGKHNYFVKGGRKKPGESAEKFVI